MMYRMIGMRKTIKHRLITVWAIIVGAIMYPVILFIPNYSNCWYYSLQRFVFEGFQGKVIPVASRRWRGYHCVYQDGDGELWEYTMEHMPRNLPWYRMLVYRGVVRKYRGKLD